MLNRDNHRSRDGAAAVKWPTTPTTPSPTVPGYRLGLLFWAISSRHDDDWLAQDAALAVPFFNGQGAAIKHIRAHLGLVPVKARH